MNDTLDKLERLICLAEALVITYHLIDNNNKLQVKTGGEADTENINFAKQLKLWIDRYQLEDIV